MSAIHNVAVNAAKHLNDSGVSLTAQPNSPLGFYVDAVSRIRNDIVTGDSNCASLSDAEALDRIGMCVSGYDISPIEDGIVANTAKDVAAALAIHVDYIKNTIKPILVEYVEEVKKRLDEPSTIRDDYNLIISELPGPMVLDSFRDEIFENNSGTYANPDYVVNVPFEGVQSILDKMLTGNNQVDDTIKNWVNKLGDDQVVWMWENIWSGKGDKLVTLMEDYKSGPDLALMAYLSSRRMVDDVPEGVVMNLSTFKTALTQVREASAIRLGHVYERDDTFIKAGLLVLKTDEYNKDIYLHASNYKRFIDEGGKNENIIGSLLLGGSVKTIGELTSKSDQFYQAYERHETIATTTRNLNAIHILRDALHTVFVDLLVDPNAREVEARNTFNLSPEGMSALASKQIQLLDGSDLKDIHKSCLRVLCRARFSYTDAEKFLTAMNEIGVVRPTIDPNEAAHLALIELVADYLSNQLGVVIRNVKSNLA